MEGYVDYWRADKGWGWVLTDDGGRFFAHITAFNPRPGAQQIVKGAIVEFDPGRTSRGIVAINIRICTAATAAQRLLEATQEGSKAGGK